MPADPMGQYEPKRLALAFAAAPAIPIVGYGVLATLTTPNSSGLLLIILLIGLPAAYFGAFVIGGPIFLVLRRLGWFNWRFFCVGGTIASMPFLLSYVLGAANTHVEIHGLQSAAFFSIFGALGGILFWALAIYGGAASGGPIALGNFAILCILVVGAYLAILGVSSTSKGVMNPLDISYVENSRRNVQITLGDGQEVEAFLPANLPHRPGCEIYVTSRRSYLRFSKLYWVTGYSDVPDVNVWELLNEQRRGEIPRSCAQASNKSLQRTFDPPPIFAAAKKGVASNAAELRR